MELPLKRFLSLAFICVVQAEILVGKHPQSFRAPNLQPRDGY
jgi:hypothetical protein